MIFTGYMRACTDFKDINAALKVRPDIILCLFFVFSSLLPGMAALRVCVCERELLY